MDQAPKLPPRPEPKNKFATDFAAQLKLYAQSSYQDRYEQHKLLNMVPPPAPPSNDHRSTAGSELFASSNHFATPLAASNSASSTTSTTSGPILTPVPLSPSRVPSSVFSSFQENLLYSMPSSQTAPAVPCKSTHTHTSNGSLSKPPSAVRPTRIISPPGTLRRDSELIDLTSLSLNDLSEEGRQSEERERKNQTIQMIKSMITAQPSSPQHSVPGTPVLSPLGVPINVPTMSPLAVQQMIGLPSGISFQPNPLYSNQGFVSSPLTNGMVGVLPPALYANLVNNNQQQQGYLNLGGSSHFASPASASASPVHIYSHIYPSSHSTTNQDPHSMYMNDMIINKINNNNNSQQQPGMGVVVSETPPSTLTPTSLFDIRQFQSSKSVIDLFDPLAQLEANGSPVHAKRATSSPIPPAPTLPAKTSPTSSIAEDETNNNDFSKRLDRSDSADCIEKGQESAKQFYQNDDRLTVLRVEERTVKYALDLLEFCDHLRALYLSVGSKNPPLTNSGLVWSPRIDISNQSGVYTGDTYMCSPAAKKQQSMSLASSSNSSTSAGNEDSTMSAIFDVRFNALVAAKLSGGNSPTPSDAKSESMWHSKKLTCSMDNVVEFIVYNVSFTFEGSRGGKSTDVNFDDFLLKINGRNEYLVPKTTLSSYVYIQQCKKMNQDVVLELVDQTLPEFWRPFLRTDADTAFITGDFTPDRLLSSESVAAFIPNNAGQLNRLLENLGLIIVQFDSFEDMESMCSERGVFNELITTIKSLCSILSKILTTRLRRAIENVTGYYQKHIIDNGTGSGGVVSMGELKRHFTLAFDELLRALAEVIHLYSVTFPVNFALSRRLCPTLPCRREDITKQIETFKLKLDVVCQVPVEWRASYMFYSLRVVIAHGFKVLDYKYSDKRTVDSEWRLEFDKEMVFESTIISELPKEARIDFHVVGVKSTSVGASKIEVDVLASTFFYLFDRENPEGRHPFSVGVHLVPFSLIKPPVGFTINSYETLDSHPPTITDSTYLVSHHLSPLAPMLVFSAWHNNPNVQYYYPKVQTTTKRPSYERSASTLSTVVEKISLGTVVPLASRSDSIVSAGGGTVYNDSLYGFYGQSIDRLDARDRSKIISIVQRNPLDPISDSERSILWEHKETLSSFPSAILKILKAPPRWSHTDVIKVCQLLDTYDYFAIPETTPTSPARQRSPSELFDSKPKKLPFCTEIEALQLLGSDFPDQNVRLKAVRWLKSVPTDELCDFLPQLVQSLRYEPHVDCSLIWLLFDCSLTSSRFCHHLHWLLKSCQSDGMFGDRCTFYLNSLLILTGGRVRKMFQLQELLCSKLETICEEIKQSKESTRQNVLRQRLEAVHEFLENCPISIPLSPAVQVCGLEISQCSYFSSNSLPLKIVFQSAPPYGTSANMIDSIGATRPNLMASIYEQKRQLNKVIFKCGDDLRQDMLVMQIISIINRMWIKANLDLRLITFAVLNNADRTGMIELVGRARTLRQIQVEHGVTGNFKNNTIADWLKRHNPSEFEYMMAVENFIHSCAGYVVITYLLGICDRHNDNIMVTTSGHLFHIDFGKFLGDAQMMAGIRRDRAPFVFTADMAYVINEGDKPSKNYQFFVDLCCRCFSQVRQNGNFLLSLLSMMIPSGIFGLSAETIKYFHNALMPDLTDSQAQSAFYRLIEKALGSYATQINFFMHTLAQLRFNSSSSSQVDSQMYYALPGSSSGSNLADLADQTGGSGLNGDGDSDLLSLEQETSDCRFSFSSKRFNKITEGEIIYLEIVDIWKRSTAAEGKEYYFKVKVDRRNLPESIVYRSYKEFLELYEKLTRIFTLIKFSYLQRKRPATQVQADSCKESLQAFLSHLHTLANEIRHSDLVYSFFHTYHRDQLFLETERGPVATYISRSRQPGKIKLVINFGDGRFNVLVMYGRNLESERNSAPDTYVKLYLIPDANKLTKRKTRVCAKNANPTYMESIVYEDMKMDDLKTKSLQVSVWANEVTANTAIGGTLIKLSSIDLTKKSESWYKLYTPGAVAQ